LAAAVVVSPEQAAGPVAAAVVLDTRTTSQSFPATVTLLSLVLADRVTSETLQVPLMAVIATLLVLLQSKAAAVKRQTTKTWELPLPTAVITLVMAAATAVTASHPACPTKAATVLVAVVQVVTLAMVVTALRMQDPLAMMALVAAVAAVVVTKPTPLALAAVSAFMGKAPAVQVRLLATPVLAVMRVLVARTLTCQIQRQISKHTAAAVLAAMAALMGQLALEQTNQNLTALMEQSALCGAIPLWPALSQAQTWVSAPTTQTAKPKALTNDSDNKYYIYFWSFFFGFKPLKWKNEI
jgi:hypothetical protein